MSNVIKIDAQRRLVFGWAQVCTKNGEDYFDTDNQHIPENVTLEAWSDFMRNGRVNKAMHAGGQVGEVAFSFPAFDDILKSLGITPGEQSGIIVGVFVNDDTVLQKYVSGEYAGFSVGGRIAWEDVPE